MVIQTEDSRITSVHQKSSGHLSEFCKLGFS